MTLKMLDNTSKFQTAALTSPLSQGPRQINTSQINNISHSSQPVPLMQPPPYSYAGIQPRLHQSIDPTSLKQGMTPPGIGVNMQSEGHSPAKGQYTHPLTQQKTTQFKSDQSSPYFPPKNAKKTQTPKSKAPRKSQAKPVAQRPRQPTSIRVSPAGVTQQPRSIPQVIIPQYSPNPSSVIVPGTHSQAVLQRPQEQPLPIQKTNNEMDIELDEGIDVVQLIPTDNAIGSPQR
jgi:hypothetical protein